MFIRLRIMAGALTFLALLTTQSFANGIGVRGQLAHAVEASGETKPDTITKSKQSTLSEASFPEPVQEGQSTAVAVSKNTLTRIMVIGDAVVAVQPDTALLSVSVVTQDKQALDAQQENATRSDTVLRAVKAVAGAGAEVKTSGYSVEPQRIYKEGQPPTITGYEARNTLLVTLSDLTKVGAVIDAAAGAGANNIDSVSFTLKNDQSARSQALTDATREAIAKARAVASALGGRVIRIAEVQEIGFRIPRPLEETQIQGRAAMAGKATPIEVGTLNVSAQVQLTVEIETNQ